MPKVVSIVYTPENVERKPEDFYARVALDRVTLIEGHGIAGDIKGNTGTRQLNIMRAETMAELAGEGLKSKPGELGEQIVIEGFPPEQFVEGARFRIGQSAEIAIGIPRTGCGRFEHIQGTSKKNVAGRLGVLATVSAAGEIVVGDEVTVID